MTAFCGLALCLAVGCRDAAPFAGMDKNPLLYSRTVKQLNNVVLENNFPPMVASRNYAYANLAAFEAMAAGNYGLRSLAGQIKHMPPMPRPAVADTAHIDYAFAALLAFCQVGGAVTFPEGSMDTYVEQLKHDADSMGMPETMQETSARFAKTIGDSILSWTKKDHYLQLRSAAKYSVNEEDGRWVPTPPMYAQAVEPHWMEMRCLVMDSCSMFMPQRPPVFNVKDTGSPFYQQAAEVMRTGQQLTEDQKHLALFWDDNPFKMNQTGHVMFATKKFSPPGHWMNIVGIAAKDAGAGFATTVAAYTHSSIALFEGFIACWDEKYRSNYVRPETVIQKHINADWLPMIQTPPFPEYTSGHAVISAATAEVLGHYFGHDRPLTDTSLLPFGIATRRFPNYRAAATEAGISRFYGGIHYRNSCQVGTAQGTQVGLLVLQRLQLLEKPFATARN